MNDRAALNHRDLLIFCLLVAIGACGRWAQPDWNFTPIAAVTIFAGYYFSRWPIALLVPVTSLAISDLALSPHDNAAVMVVTYLAMTLPVALGRGLRNEANRTGRLVRYALCGIVPATVFFATTNLTVWAFQSNYERTFAGLAECYWAAVPFYRAMLAGDIFYLAVIFGCYALAQWPLWEPARQRVAQRMPHVTDR